MRILSLIVRQEQVVEGAEPDLPRNQIHPPLLTDNVQHRQQWLEDEVAQGPFSHQCQVCTV